MDTLVKLYSNREFLLILIAVALSAVLTSLLSLPDLLDPLLVFSVLSVSLYIGWKFFTKSLETPLLAYLVLQLLFLWMGLDQLLLGKVGIHAKPHVLAVGMGTLASLAYIVKDFKYFWRFPLFRCTSIFFMLNILYYLFYSSDFTISSVSAGYPLGSGLISEFSEANAKSIVLMGSLGTFISTTCGLAVFKNRTPDAIKGYLLQIIPLMTFSALVYFLLTAANAFQSTVPGNGVIVTILFFMLLGFSVWINRTAPDLKVFGMKLLPVLFGTIGLNFICLFFAMNKTTLVGFSFCLLVYALLNQTHGFKIDYVGLVNEKLRGPLNKILVIGLLLLGGIALLSSGILEVFSDKISYFYKGFSSLSTLSVRTGNWYYFIDEWFDTLNPFKALFGYGIGESRQTIFYISAMRQAGSVTLVQTLHDSYLEFFYDYGLMALIYYFGVFSVFTHNVKSLLNQNLDTTTKGFSLMSLILILYIAIYAVMDGIRVPVLIEFFSAIAMVEGLRLGMVSSSSQGS